MICSDNKLAVSYTAIVHTSKDGINDGTLLGRSDGISEGIDDGCNDGIVLGTSDGLTLGDDENPSEGEG